MGYLIPEFISLSGMSDEQRANFTIMKEIAPITKLKPSERLSQTKILVQVLNKNGRLKIREPKRITAFQLAQPNIKLYGNYVMKNNGDGNMIVRDKLKEPVDFKDYVVVYSRGKNHKDDDREADELCENLVKASQSFGINFK